MLRVGQDCLVERLSQHRLQVHEEGWPAELVVERGQALCQMAQHQHHCQGQQMMKKSCSNCSTMTL